MKRILYLACLLFFTQNIFCQSITTIKLKTIKDSVGVMSGCLDCNDKRYAHRYKFENPNDSLFVNLGAWCSTEGMDPTIKCKKTYSFVDSIADGIYKIVIDGKPIKKITFQNGKKHGLECTYRQSKLGSLSNKGGYHFVQNYANGRTTEYYMLDKKGNVIGFSPVIFDHLNHSRIELTYYFDKGGQLRSIRYHTIALADYFSKSGEYIEMELLSEEKTYNGKPSKRYIYQLKTIEKNGMIENKKPNGMIEIQRYTTKYRLNFKEGIVLNWLYSTDDPAETLEFDISSEKIGINRPDLLSFCKK